MFLIRIEKQKTKHNDYFFKSTMGNIIMANYEIDPEILLPYLPKGVEHLYKGKAYVSLVGFMFKKTRLFNVLIPYFGTLKK
jgi:uncharacterized protein YqjF (DUF2071 family)